jgi:hypothetical protein
MIRVRLKHVVAVSAVIGAGAFLAGCQPPWVNDYGPTYRTPSGKGSPELGTKDVAPVLRRRGFEVKQTGATFGLRRDMEVSLVLGRDHRSVAQQAAALTEHERQMQQASGVAGGTATAVHRAVCNVHITVLNRSLIPAYGRERPRGAKTVPRAADAVERLLAPHCEQRENLTPLELADVIWGSGLDFEIRRQAGAQLFAPALKLESVGGWGPGDDGWFVTVRIFENTETATDAMDQHDEEHGYQSEGPIPGNQDLWELGLGDHHQACNAVVSFSASLSHGPGPGIPQPPSAPPAPGLGMPPTPTAPGEPPAPRPATPRPYKNPYVPRANRVRVQAEAAANDLRELCDSK